MDDKTDQASQMEKAEKSKRLGNSTFGGPRFGDTSDEEDFSLFLPQTKKIKKEPRGDSPCLFSALTPLRGYSRKDGALAANSYCRAGTKDREIEVEDIDPDKVKVYVGNPHVVFTIRRSGLQASPVLDNLVIHNATNGCYVMAPWLSSISGDDFGSVAEFLDRGDYHPHIVGAHSDKVHLAGITSDEERREEILKCAVVFAIAQKLEISTLQALAASKLELLQPYPAREFLALSGLAFGMGLAGQDRLDKLVVDYFSVSGPSQISVCRAHSDNCPDPHILPELLRLASRQIDENL
ncbi:MAG: hypothetical protein Q9222_000005 [Ikaeria aurantiellina]